jgi:tellurite resistance protein
MSTRIDYTAEEWEMIRRTPAEAIVAIEQASGSGFFGRRHERKAAERGFGDAIAEFSGLELIDALVAAQEDEGRLVDGVRASGESMIDTAVETAATARRAIQAKGTREELEAYVSAILDTAQAVALAAGVSGAIGHMSPAEALVLSRLAGALGRPDYEPPKDDWVGLPPPNKE